MKMITLRELCDKTGVTRRVIQGYENYSLISSVGKNERGHLLYEELVIETVKELQFYNRIGIRRRELKTFLALEQEERNKILREKQKALKKQKENIEKLLEKLELL